VKAAAKGKQIFDVNLRTPFIDKEAILACMPGVRLEFY
jgi:hypothetical protein